MSRSKKLLRLQKIDTSIDRARDRIQEIEQTLAQDKALVTAQKKENKAKDKLEEKRKQLKRTEREVKDQERKIEDNASKLYGGNVTNPKELEDLQLESESLKRYLKVLEERQLEAMMEVEEAQQAHQEALHDLENIKAERKSLHSDLIREKEELQDNISDSLEKKDSAYQNLDPSDLKHYQELRQSLGGIAVAYIENESCSACGTRVPSAIYQEARSPSQITHCKTCSRILHAD